jgi:hypothetical protein
MNADLKSFFPGRSATTGFESRPIKLARENRNEAFRHQSAVALLNSSLNQDSQDISGSKTFLCLLHDVKFHAVKSLMDPCDLCLPWPGQKLDRALTSWRLVPEIFVSESWYGSTVVLYNCNIKVHSRILR